MKKRLFLMFFLITVSALAASAQSSPEQAIKNARDQFTDLKNRSIELERTKREAAKRPAGDNSTPAFPQIKEDFEEIQKLSRNVLESTAAKSPVDYDDVLKIITEINHRAIRLKSNLFSAESEQKQGTKNEKQPVIEAQNVSAVLDALDKSINNFVHSSLFQNTKLINSQDSLNAQHDLETTIEISSSIRENLKKLKKNHSRN